MVISQFKARHPTSLRLGIRRAYLCEAVTEEHSPQADLCDFLGGTSHSLNQSIFIGPSEWHPTFWNVELGEGI